MAFLEVKNDHFYCLGPYYGFDQYCGFGHYYGSGNYCGCRYYEDLPDEIFGELAVMLLTLKKSIKFGFT